MDQIAFKTIQVWNLVQSRGNPLRKTVVAALLLFLVQFVFLIPTASAAPIELTAGAFASQTAGLPKIVETFEGFSIGLKPSPLSLANGTYVATSPNILNSAIFCGTADNCLIDSSDLISGRKFSLFPAGTTYWAVAEFFPVLPLDVFQVLVTGNSGSSTFTHITSGNFWGFTDPLGLQSVEFTNLGHTEAGGLLHGNYGFDLVTTATPTGVPEASSATLLMAGIVLVGFMARCQSRVSLR
jgi:hypothetical protein